MITVNGKELRNLEEQVEKNKQDIQDFKDGNQTIAQFGITVVGILTDANQLPATGDNFGDAYLIGTETPYDMRVWTRNIPKQKAMWVDLGNFPLAGPQGEQGEKGTSITSGNGIPTAIARIGDMYINTATGILYTYGDTGWLKSFSIKGPKGEIGPQGKQGIQGLRGLTGLPGAVGPKGDKGDKGDYGPSFNIQGTLASVDNLPTPTEAAKSKGYAYIILIDGVKHIYVIQGEGSDMIWVDLGPSGVQGEKGDRGVGIDTLTDLDLTLGDMTVTYDTEEGVSITSTGRAAYEGEQHDFTTDLQIPLIGTDGITIDKAADSEKIEISGKNFVEKKVQEGSWLYGTKGQGEETTWQINSMPKNLDIPIYSGTSLRTGTPSADTDAANKKYVDDNFVNDSTPGKNVTGAPFIPVKLNGNTTWTNKFIRAQASVAVNGYDIVGYDGGGAAYVPNVASNDKSITNKKYVDDAIASAALGTYTFKTLFGNQNIVGSGNIDLYRHRVSFTWTEAPFTVFYTEIISSQSFPIDSLTDLKTYLGDTFTQPLYGGSYTDKYAGSYLTNAYVFYIGAAGLERASITGFTIADTVTTV